jgi:hypothetical protein
MLIVFPLGSLITALIFDVLYFATDNDAFATTAFWCIAAGIIGGLLAAVFGLIDWLNIPSGTRAKAIGIWHGINLVADRANSTPTDWSGGSRILPEAGWPRAWRSGSLSAQAHWRWE